MPEVGSIPIIKSPEKPPISNPEAKKYPELQQAWTNVWGVLTDAQTDKRFSRSKDGWLADKAFNDIAQRSPEFANLCANTMVGQGERINAGIQAIDRYEKGVQSGEIETKDGRLIEQTEATAKTKVMEAANAYTDAIEGLEYIIACTDGRNDDSRALNKRAKEALAGIQHNVSVMKSMTDGNVREASYTQWSGESDKTAYEVWSGGDTAKTREEFDKLPATVRYVWRAHARSQEELTKKGITKISCELIYAPDGSESPKPEEKNPEKSEQLSQEELQNNAIRPADVFCRKTIGKSIKELVQAASEGKNIEIPGDPTLSWMVEMRLLLAELQKPGNRSNLDAIRMATAELTNAVSDFLSTHRWLESGQNADEEVTKATASLNRNLKYYDYQKHPQNNPVYAYMLGRLRALHYPVENLPNIRAGRLPWIITLLSPAIEADKANPPSHYSSEASHVSKLLHRLRIEDLITSEEQGFLDFLGTNSKEGHNLLENERTLFAAEIGIPINKINTLFSMDRRAGCGLSNSLRTQIPAIANLIYDYEGNRDPEGHIIIPANAQEAMAQLFSFVPADIQKYLYKKEGGWSTIHTVSLFILWQKMSEMMEFTGDEQAGPGASMGH